MRYDGTPKPPEWWTTENTEAWTREQWGNPDDASAAQRSWGRKYGRNDIVPKASRMAPPTPELMARWRVNDPRPSASIYYDGTPITRYQPLRLKKQRKAKVAA